MNLVQRLLGGAWLRTTWLSTWLLQTTACRGYLSEEDTPFARFAMALALCATAGLLAAGPGPLYGRSAPMVLLKNASIAGLVSVALRVKTPWLAPSMIM